MYFSGDVIWKGVWMPKDRLGWKGSKGVWQLVDLKSLQTGAQTLFKPPGDALSVSRGDSVLWSPEYSIVYTLQHPCVTFWSVMGASNEHSQWGFFWRAQWELLLASRNMEMLTFPWDWVASNGILNAEHKLCSLLPCSDLTVLLLRLGFRRLTSLPMIVLSQVWAWVPRKGVQCHTTRAALGGAGKQEGSRVLGPLTHVSHNIVSEGESGNRSRDSLLFWPKCGVCFGILVYASTFLVCSGIAVLMFSLQRRGLTQTKIADWFPFFALPPLPIEVENHFKGSDVLVPDATQLLLEESEI